MYLIVEASKEKKTKPKPTCCSQFCRGRKDPTVMQNLSLHRRLCLVIPMVIQLRPLQRGSRGRLDQRLPSTAHDLTFGTTDRIFWKQFKQQQMVAGLFKLTGPRESQTELA